MNCCVIIPSHYSGLNTKWLLTQCLLSIKKYEPALLPHTYIIDDASEHKNAGVIYAELQERFKINIAYKKQKQNYSSVINTGLRFVQSKYEFCVLMNNDIELKSHFVGRINGVFEMFEDCAIVGTKLYYPSGRIQHSGISFTPDHSLWLHERSRFEIGDAGDSNTPRFMFAVTGAFHILRSSMLPKLGLYSDAYAFGYEDVEYCLRAWSMDYSVFYDPYIEAIHQESASRGYGLNERELKSQEQFKKDRDKYDLPEISQKIIEKNKLMISKRG